MQGQVKAGQPERNKNTPPAAHVVLQQDISSTHLTPSWVKYAPGQVSFTNRSAPPVAQRPCTGSGTSAHLQRCLFAASDHAP